MQYDSQQQKNLVMNALTAYAVPLGQRSTVDPIVTQLAKGEIVSSESEIPFTPAPLKAVKKVKKGGKKK